MNPPDQHPSDPPPTPMENKPSNAHAPSDSRPGGPSAKTFRRAGSANHQIDSKETRDV